MLHKRETQFISQWRALLVAACHNLPCKLSFTPRCMYNVKYGLVPQLLRCNALHLLILVALTPHTFLYQLPFAPDICYRQHLHQAPFAPNTSYTYRLHQAQFTRDTLYYTTRLLHKNLGGVWCGRRIFIAMLVYQGVGTFFFFTVLGKKMPRWSH